MKPEPFGPRGRGRENGFRCPAERPRITNSKAVAIGTAIAIIASLFRAGCMSGGHGVKRMAGARARLQSPGAYTGSTAGSGKLGIAATVAGTMAGLFPCSGIGASLENLYAVRARQAALETRPSGAPSRWHNPSTGNAGAITPARTYRSAGGIYCREYQLTVTAGGRHRASTRQRLPPSQMARGGYRTGARACPW